MITTHTTGAPDPQGESVPRTERRRGVQWVFEVQRTERVSAQLVRVHLGGEAFAGFIAGASPDKLDLTDKYVKFLFPRPGHDLDPPYDLDALRQTMSRDELPVRRTYTIRAIDDRARTLAVDFVVHGEEGIAGPWAARARPGDRVALSGPGGGYAPSGADVTHLLIGDDSAIPAVSAAIEALPLSARGLAILEVDEDDCRVDLVAPDAMEVRWLYRADANSMADPGSLLVDEVAALDRPNGEVGVFAHGERDAMKQIGAILHGRWGLSRQEMSLSAYWARGRAEDAFQAEKRAPIGQIFADR